MPRDARGDRLPERFLDVGAATPRVTRCFQFSQVVSSQSCRTTPGCYDPHPQPQQPRSGCSAPAWPAEHAIRTSRRFGLNVELAAEPSVEVGEQAGQAGPLACSAPACSDAYLSIMTSRVTRHFRQRLVEPGQPGQRSIAWGDRALIEAGQVAPGPRGRIRQQRLDFHASRRGHTRSLAARRAGVDQGQELRVIRARFSPGC